ncbi:hypothetical protein JQ035_15190 [Clostridium botulinum]|nr:hypothetical protein [Clostridium botulinum]
MVIGNTPNSINCGYENVIAPGNNILIKSIIGAFISIKVNSIKETNIVNIDTWIAREDF